MPQDLVQIALEHHRAGRLTQAEAGYRAALAADSQDADAMHWLGVLLHQANQTPAAIPLLQSAAAIRPEDGAFQHNLGQAYMSAGRKDDAIASFDRAVKSDPASREALASLVHARLARAKPGDAATAIEVLQMAQANGLDWAELSQYLAMALLAAGQNREAIEACQAALKTRQDDPLVYYYLGLASRAVGELKETRKSLIKALELDPTMSQGWCALAMLDAEAGNYTSAAGLCRRAIAADRDSASAQLLLAKILRKAGKPAEADAVMKQWKLQLKGSARAAAPSTPSSVAELERHLTPTADQARAHFAMAALLNIFPPMQIPGESVADLFDRYAPKFDAHLVGTLDYHVPEKLIEALKPHCTGQPLDVLDAGCGTGLCGPLLRPMARNLAGVDLSSAMIEKARERGVYDHLEVSDLVESLLRSPAAFDLLICADVLIYLGESAPFYEAAALALRPGGLLALSVEAASGDRFELVPRSRRFRHSKSYLQRVASMYGWKELDFQTIVIRKELDQPVNGFLVILRKPE